MPRGLFRFGFRRATIDGAASWLDARRMSNSPWREAVGHALAPDLSFAHMVLAFLLRFPSIAGAQQVTLAAEGPSYDF
jgi:hypothetical protein